MLVSCEHKHNVLVEYCVKAFLCVFNLMKIIMSMKFFLYIIGQEKINPSLSKKTIVIILILTLLVINYNYSIVN